MASHYANRSVFISKTTGSITTKINRSGIVTKTIIWQKLKSNPPTLTIIIVNEKLDKQKRVQKKYSTMRDMESWAVCYRHCKCTFTVIMIDIFKKTVKLT
jgi:DNA polymerase III delta subunit